MITLRQIEAIYWIAKLGTFEGPAARLNTTQSAVSKRIHELEAATGLHVFDRRRRGARLTTKGEHVLALARDMLTTQGRVLELKNADDVPAGRVRLGVTEFSALTWLPRLIAALRDACPLITVEPEVDMSRDLYDRLHEDKLDIIVIPDAFSDPQVTAVPLAETRNVWMASPTLVQERRTLSLEQLVQYPILVQGNRSGSGVHVSRWLKSEGVTLPRVMSCDSLIALLGLTVARLGVTYLPKQCFTPLVDAGKLRIVPTRPALPDIPYAAMYRNDRPFAVTSLIATVAQSTCNFTRQLQG